MDGIMYFSLTSLTRDFRLMRLCSISSAQMTAMAAITVIYLNRFFRMKMAFAGRSARRRMR